MGFNSESILIRVQRKYTLIVVTNQAWDKGTKPQALHQTDGMNPLISTTACNRSTRRKLKFCEHPVHDMVQKYTEHVP